MPGSSATHDPRSSLLCLPVDVHDLIVFVVLENLGESYDIDLDLETGPAGAVKGLKRSRNTTGCCMVLKHDQILHGRQNTTTNPPTYIGGLGMEKGKPHYDGRVPCGGLSDGVGERGSL